MTQLERVRVGLSGFTGGPGVATFYFLDVATALPSLQSLWTVLAQTMPNIVTIQVENSGDVIEDTTGTIVDQWTQGAEAPIFGGLGGKYSAPSGYCLNWLTQTILDGHRLKGRTFVVPTGVDIYDLDGTIVTATVNAVNTAAATYVNDQSASAVVWHRPRKARPADGSRPAVTARAGGHGLITSALVRDKAAVLTSRRD
jgi:hypothetical protein